MKPKVHSSKDVFHNRELFDATGRWQTEKFSHLILSFLTENVMKAQQNHIIGRKSLFSKQSNDILLVTQYIHQ